MMKTGKRFLIVATVLMGLGAFAGPQADAGWWHGWGYGYYGWGYGGYAVCSPCWTPVYSVGICDPCCGDWYLGVRPGPIRRAVFGPYRWYPAYGGCSLCYADPCCCSPSCCVSGGTVAGAPADVQSTQRPTLAPPNEPAPAPTPPTAPPAGTPN
ncbi:MAG: hypothetical protein ACYC6Y_04480, partial [Thermoguttaceae bacterium]